jgi:membrane associated rhomboid family serine protease
MGFADRDYYRNDPPRGSAAGGLPNFRTWSVTYWLIAINIVVFLVDGENGLLVRLFGPKWWPTAWGCFDTQDAIVHLQLWRFITFQFLHANAQHIVFNMFALYLFGQLIESVLGPRRFLAFYLLSGIGGALSLLLLESVRIIPGSMNSFLVGASAGIFGLLVASAIVVPDVRIIVLVFPMRIRTAAILATVMALYAVATAGNNYGGEAAHLGGGVVGFILIKNINVLNFLLPKQRGGMYIGPRSQSSTLQKDWTNDPDR